MRRLIDMAASHFALWETSDAVATRREIRVFDCASIPARKAGRLPQFGALVILACSLLLAFTTPISAEPPTAEQTAFFEAKVRPILVDHCYKCHAADSDDIEAGLVLDSKSGWQTGGDSGAAIVPGNLDESLLIQAVRYEEDLVSGMPPKSKLPSDKIAILEHWVSMGAPDPRIGGTNTGGAATKSINAFNLQERFNEHWSWRPIASPEPPAVSNPEWSVSAIDRFVGAKLEQAELKPAPQTDRRTWLRRVYLDLIGMPPSVTQIERFIADESDNAHQSVVNELLDSPFYGEKWARHWMDLVRYCESYGHEFDYPIRNAHEYRDYLIRAFNADVPYDQFAREQIAGDMLESPRRHAEKDFNESIIGTGFWYFHDATHAPTDSLGNEADIMDNQIDVFGKSFLGLTVACARCHDHKFDAISTADYYALSAFIQSSCRQYAPLDVGHKIETISDQIEPLRCDVDDLLRENANANSIDADRLQELALNAQQAQVAVQQTWSDEGSELIADFSGRELPAGWSTSGHAFVPVSTQLMSADGGALEPGTVSSRMLGRKQHGILRSPTFELTGSRIHVRVKATAGVSIKVIIDNYQMGTYNALLFKGTFVSGKDTETNGAWVWKSLAGDLRKYIGHKVYLEFVDNSDGFIEIDEIRMSDQDAPTVDSEIIDPKSIADRWTDEIENLRQAKLGPFTAWAIESGSVSIGELNSAAGMKLNEMTELADQIPAPRYVLAMAEGTRENSHVYVRGSHKTLGDEVPPRFLEALGGREANRLELANMVVSPDNPLTARVIVNRLWHHLFGRGIVPTVDDFGPQGRLPSHPELLDWLATDLIQNGWSLKHMIGQMVLSQTYRQQSVPDPRNSAERIATVDPTNALLHKMTVRRLPSESIRDSILAISGRLDPKQFGPSVPTHLTSFMTGRGRPSKSGPVDGNGRRTIYLAVTRNFLNPFLLTFDMPSPFGPQGRRSQSNVPAQALTLLNDPFVIEQANLWTDNVLAIPDLNDTQRAALMMEQSHGVIPSPHQATAMEKFLANQSAVYGTRDRRAWADLAHSLLNMKAFYYVR